MNIPQTALQELNACLAQMIRAWMRVSNMEARFYFWYEDDLFPQISNVKSYSIELDHILRFEDCILDENGNITITRCPDTGLQSVSIYTFISIVFPEPVMEVLAQHKSTELFEADLDYLNFGCEINLPESEYFYAITLLSGSISNLRLQGLEEAVFRVNAEALCEALQPFANWFDYAAALANGIEDETRRVQLI